MVVTQPKQMDDRSHGASPVGADAGADLHVVGGATAYRLLDVGYSISLDQARKLDEKGEAARGWIMPP